MRPGSDTDAAAGRTVWLFLKRFNTGLLRDSAIPLLGVYPEKLKRGLELVLLTPCAQQQDS